MDKLKAFAVHLGISLIIFLIILYFIVFHWYPPPFFTTDGGWQGIQIIAAVDLVLGPLLTFIVYKKGKKSLKFDLSSIAFVQIGALAWGVWVVHHERPYAAIYTEDHFTTVLARDIESKFDDKRLADYGGRTPVWIYSDLPDDPNELQKIRVRAIQFQRNMYLFDEYYHVIDDYAREKMRKNGFDVADWVNGKTEDEARYQEFMQQHSEVQDKIIFYPWHARHTWYFIALHSETFEYIGLLDVIPPNIEEQIEREKKKNSK